ncbi:hypothetical protein GGR52DRAFT_59916 [Hypoxylon sp. FL1284]|nr:hypothetical protein GGR52DRAFT_59916 [Hypoxylon sp. FL1284]
MEVFHTFWTDTLVGAVLQRRGFKNLMLAQGIAKRSVETLAPRSTGDDIGSVILYILFVIEVAIALLVFLFTTYTLSSVFPVLAIVEDDPAASAYEPVQAKDEPESEEPVAQTAGPGDEESAPPRPPPVSSSLRSLLRLLCAERGYRGVWRGYEYATLNTICISLATFASLIFVPTSLGFLGFALANVLTVQFGVAWTHAVVSHPRLNSFWHRVPPFGLAFRATAAPALVASLASGITQTAPPLLTRTLFGNDVGVVAALSMLAEWSLLFLFVVVPPAVVLVRVRASLLPEGDRPIVAYDRALTAHRASGREYMSMVDAWKSFSFPAWRRLLKLYFKVLGVSALAFLAVGLIGGLEFFLVSVIFQKH